MNPMLGAALIGGGSQLGGSLLSNIWQTTQQAGQREHQYQMTDYLYSKDLEQWERQNQYNLEMWNLQNEYNSPKSQMARFDEAGLNPNLIYGQGQPGMASPVQKSPDVDAKGEAVNTARVSVAPIDVMRNYLDIRMQNQQLKNMEQARLNSITEGQIKEQELIVRALEAGYKPEEIEQMRARFGQESSLWPLQTAAAQIQINKMNAEIMQIAQHMNLTEKEMKKLDAWLQAWDDGVNIDRAPWWYLGLYKSWKDTGGYASPEFRQATEDRLLNYEPPAVVGFDQLK